MSKEPVLSELIAEKKGERSYDQLARDCGGTPSRQRLHQLLTNELRGFPDAASIQGLARGLAVTETDVVMAASRSLGLNVYSGSDPSALSIGGAGVLPASAKETVIRVAREFLELASQRADGVNDEDSGTATSTAQSRSGSGVRDSGRAPMTPAEILAEMERVHADRSITEEQRTASLEALGRRLSATPATSIAEGDGDAGARVGTGT